MFGAFRKYYPGTLEITVPFGSSAQCIKSAIGIAIHEANPTFCDDELISKSALANQQRVLNDDEQITEHSSLAILPPVCGG